MCCLPKPQTLQFPALQEPDVGARSPRVTPRVRKSREPRCSTVWGGPRAELWRAGEILHKAAFGSKKFGPFLGWESLRCWREGVPWGVFLA